MLARYFSVELMETGRILSHPAGLYDVGKSSRYAEQLPSADQRWRRKTAEAFLG